ncbi:MAG: hypothetical protein HPY66_2932 [Firmicutes bacterium]|nr:hypothetical protein [Bacillota bacterium]
MLNSFKIILPQNIPFKKPFFPFNFHTRLSVSHQQHQTKLKPVTFLSSKPPPSQRY